MKNINVYIKKKTTLTTLLATTLYLLISLAIFWPLLSSPGIILGGDWSLPASLVQLEAYFNQVLYPWSNTLLGDRSLGLSALPLLVIYQVLALFFRISLTAKLILVILFFLSSFSFYLLLRYLKVYLPLAFIGGLIYSTTPIFFNYIIMGWVFILLAMSLLPFMVLYFIKAAKEQNAKNIAILGLISFFAVQAQFIVWVSLIWLALSFYLIKSKKDVLIYLKYFFLSLAIYLLVNSYWLLGMLFFPDPRVTSSDILTSDVSWGIVAHLHPINTIRLYGSLYNFQFETIINTLSPLIFQALSFLLPILAVLSLFIKKNIKLVIALWSVGIIPFFLYILNFHREILLSIPFANVFRDFSRFTIISTFAYCVLAVISLNYLYLKNHKKLLIFIIAIWAVSVYPWWTNKITTWQDGVGQDIRLRTKIFPQEYLETENYLASLLEEVKVLYLPINGMADYYADPRFHSSYKETRDIFAQYSPLPGGLEISDRNLGFATDFVTRLKQNLATDLLKTIEPTNIKYIVVRTDMLIPNHQEILNQLDQAVENDLLSIHSTSANLVVYARNTTPPHLYATSETATVPKLTFTRINPAKYRILVEEATEPYQLVFLEKFHPYWKIYLDSSITNINRYYSNTIANYPLEKVNESNHHNIFFTSSLYDTWNKPTLADSSHAPIYGLANSWKITPQNVNGQTTYQLILEFQPLKLTYLGLGASLLVLLSCLFYLVKKNK